MFCGVFVDTASFFSEYICDVLYDLLPFVQFKKHEKHLWGSAAFSKVATYSKPKFLKLYKWYHIVQSISTVQAFYKKLSYPSNRVKKIPNDASAKLPKFFKPKPRKSFVKLC